MRLKKSIETMRLKFTIMTYKVEIMTKRKNSIKL